MGRVVRLQERTKPALSLFVDTSVWSLASGPKARRTILDYFSALPVLTPDRRDHIEAADLRNGCRRAGVQIGTIDAVLAQLCIRNDLTMLTTDEDFRRIALRFPLKVWSD